MKQAKRKNGKKGGGAEAIYQMVTDKILESLAKGTIPWRKPWNGGRTGVPRNLIRNKPYSGINFILCLCSEYENPYWVTFKEAKKLGGTVKKGQKGMPIIFWKIIDEDKEGNKLDREDYIYILRYYTIFNVEQCEGLKHKRLTQYEEAQAKKNDDGIEFNPIKEAEELLKAWEDCPEILHEEQRAYYRPSSDIINMPKENTFHSVVDYYDTLFHECTHATGHESRVGRDLKGGMNKESYSKEELVAEIGGAYLCGICGIESDIDNSASYIEGWSKKLKDDNKLIVSASQKAKKAVNYIIGEEV